MFAWISSPKLSLSPDDSLAPQDLHAGHRAREPARKLLLSSYFELLADQILREFLVSCFRISLELEERR